MISFRNRLHHIVLSALAGPQLQRADDAVDQRLRSALIGHRLEDLGKLADAERQRHLIVLGQHLLQIALGGNRLAARFLDDLVRFLLADLGAKRERDRLGHDQPARFAEIDAHALAVDLEALGDLDDGVEGARGDQRQRRKRLPLRLPAAECALVLLHLRRHDGGE